MCVDGRVEVTVGGVAGNGQRSGERHGSHAIHLLQRRADEVLLRVCLDARHELRLQVVLQHAADIWTANDGIGGRRTHHLACLTDAQGNPGDRNDAQGQRLSTHRHRHRHTHSDSDNHSHT